MQIENNNFKIQQTEIVMARLFSINIDFENKEYTVLVSIREVNHDICCLVRYVDKSLRYILPGDILEFSLEEGFKQPQVLPDELAHNLVASTTAALSNHFALKDSA
jgi:hypothetical protein